MKTNVCLYTRVSTDAQDYKRQVADIKKYCKANSYDILQEFCEKETGKRRERKALNDLLKYCKENQDNLTFVIVSELSRLGRTGQVIFTIETLNDYKIGLISLKENLKTLNEDKTVNHTSGLIVSILSSINSYELETTKYRSKSGLLYSAKQGNWGGGNRLPYGYMRQGKKLVINPSESVTIEEIFNMYLNGKGTLSIATILNGRNVPTRTGVRWRDKVVYDIICNPLYCGKRRYKGEILSAPAIISGELFEKVTKLRTSNYNKIGNNSKYDHLLSNRILVCGVCGKHYFAHKRKDNSDNAYKCLSIRYLNNCGNISISIDKLEYAIKYIFLFNYVQLVKIENDNSEEIRKENHIYDSELKKIKSQINRLIELYTDGLINKSEFQARQDKFKQKEIQLEEMKQSNIERISEISKAKELIKKINVENVGSYFEVYEISKEMIKQVVKNIIITKDDLKLTENKQDKTVKVDINSITGSTVTIFLSQRANFFLWNDNQVEYDLNLNQVIQTTGA